MANIRIDFRSSGLANGYESLTSELEALAPHRRDLHARQCAGSDFLGWLSLPSDMLKQLEGRIFEYATRLNDECDVVVVIGIGGSYLGAKALYDALPESVCGTELVFLGCNLCPDYLANQLARLHGKRVGVIVISKSGTTTEPALALRMLLSRAPELTGGPIPPERIVAITDRSRGALHDQAVAEGWGMLEVPDDVGGRYSVLSAVGLLPLAVAGINVKELLTGAADCENEYINRANHPVDAMIYAAWRVHQYGQGRQIELLAAYTPYVTGLAEWYKQLFAESEGKQGKGVFPTSAIFTTDLHSLGQYFQQGHRLFFGTHLQFEKSLQAQRIPSNENDGDGLNYLSGRDFHSVNLVAQSATQQAHLEGGLPSLSIWIARRDAYYLGALIYFFEYACALSCLHLGVNPFDQPGVEAYKNHMFTQLGKPGY